MADYADSLWNDILGFADYCLAGDTEILIPTMTRRSKKIKDIVEDQYELFVLSHDGDDFNPWVSQKVSQWHHRGSKDVYRYTLEDGSYVDCTPEHTFLAASKDYLPIDLLYTKNIELFSLKD
jgi:intein/homing endonuclease